MSFVAVDVQYSENSARAAALIFESVDDERPSASFVEPVADIQEYIPGQFFRRELPCILQVLARIAAPISLVIVDGYVSLGPDMHPGLGWHLWESLGKSVPVIGVAKTAFHGTPFETEVLRGDSLKPLFVTSVGIPLDDAKRMVADMHGSHRIPALLRLVDQLARGTAPQAS